VVVVEIEWQPTELVAEVVYLAQQPPGRLVTQIRARLAIMVKEAALKLCHPPSESVPLGQR
jgi:hypothetical protein